MIAMPKVRGAPSAPYSLRPYLKKTGARNNVLFSKHSIEKQAQAVNPPLTSATQSLLLLLESVVLLGPPLSAFPSRSSSVPLKWFVTENFINYSATMSTWARFHTSTIHLVMVA